jgi:hypothetical protein
MLDFPWFDGQGRLPATTMVLEGCAAASPPVGTISSARLIELVAATLGWEKSAEVVGAAVGKLGLSTRALTADQALCVLAELAQAPGMAGIAARFARSRLEGAPAPASSSEPASGLASAPAVVVGPARVGDTLAPPAPVDSRPLGTLGSSIHAGDTPVPQPFSTRADSLRSHASGAAVTADEVAELLASTMGADKALEVVLDAARRLDFDEGHLDHVQALSLLDHLAVEPGLVGLCARFGKTRLLLRFAA